MSVFEIGTSTFMGFCHGMRWIWNHDYIFLHRKIVKEKKIKSCFGNIDSEKTETSKHALTKTKQNPKTISFVFVVLLEKQITIKEMRLRLGCGICLSSLNVHCLFITFLSVFFFFLMPTFLSSSLLSLSLCFLLCEREHNTV